MFNKSEDISTDTFLRHIFNLDNLTLWQLNVVIIQSLFVSAETIAKIDEAL